MTSTVNVLWKRCTKKWAGPFEQRHDSTQLSSDINFSGETWNGCTSTCFLRAPRSLDLLKDCGLVGTLFHKLGKHEVKLGALGKTVSLLLRANVSHLERCFEEWWRCICPGRPCDNNTAVCTCNIRFHILLYFCTYVSITTIGLLPGLRHGEYPSRLSQVKPPRVQMRTWNLFKTRKREYDIYYQQVKQCVKSCNCIKQYSKIKQSRLRPSLVSVLQFEVGHKYLNDRRPWGDGETTM